MRRHAQVIFLLMWAGLASASDFSDGLYLRAEAGQISLGSTVDLDYSGVFIGERLGIWSVELGKLNSSSNSVQLSSSEFVFGSKRVNTVPGRQSIKHQAYELNTSVDLWEFSSGARVQFFAGLNDSETHVSSSSQVLKHRYGFMGVGLSWRVLDQLVLDARVTEGEDVERIALGLQWRIE